MDVREIPKEDRQFDLPSIDLGCRKIRKMKHAEVRRYSLVHGARMFWPANEDSQRLMAHAFVGWNGAYVVASISPRDEDPSHRRRWHVAKLQQNGRIDELGPLSGEINTPNRADLLAKSLAIGGFSL